MIQCLNCGWVGKSGIGIFNNCIKCGDNTISIDNEQDVVVADKMSEFDLNKDGKFDSKDISLAGKVLKKASANKKKRG